MTEPTTTARTPEAVSDAVECAIGLNVDCGGTAGVHRVRDAVLAAIQPELDALAALRAVARGYCPACGRGDAAPTVKDWEQQRQRAERAEQHSRAAEFTARHWRQALIDNIPAAHAIACISAAIGGQTDPNQLGVDEAVHDAFRDALDEPTED